MDGKTTDEIDQGCVKCTSKENEANVSLSSSDDETEQVISLNMNKKSNSIAYKGKCVYVCVWGIFIADIFIWVEIWNKNQKPKSS